MRNRSPSIASAADFHDKPLGDLERAAFCCEDEAVDKYITGDRIARDVANFYAAAFVLTPPDDGMRIASFYTLSNYSVVKANLSKTKQKLYAYDAIASVIIGYLGVDKNFRGLHLGPRTLRLALERCYRISRESGAALVVVDVETKNQRAIDMYHDADFEDLGVKTTASGFELLTLCIKMKKIALALA